ncbi:MAG: hypothetical protein KC619_04395, partial [Myxococcales bacterium]|nr:hypothetical protein [Myxococcales bacterium]
MPSRAPMRQENGRMRQSLARPPSVARNPECAEPMSNAVKKPKTVYVCADCGADTLRWMGKCPGCG